MARKKQAGIPAPALLAGGINRAAFEAPTLALVDAPKPPKRGKRMAERSDGVSVATPIPAPQPRFDDDAAMRLLRLAGREYTIDGDEPTPGTTIVDANPDDPEIAATLDSLDCGHATTIGGGAAPLRTIRRVDGIGAVDVAKLRAQDDAERPESRPAPSPMVQPDTDLLAFVDVVDSPNAPSLNAKIAAVMRLANTRGRDITARVLKSLEAGQTASSPAPDVLIALRLAVAELGWRAAASTTPKKTGAGGAKRPAHEPGTKRVSRYDDGTPVLYHFALPARFAAVDRVRVTDNDDGTLTITAVPK